MMRKFRERPGIWVLLLLPFFSVSVFAEGASPSWRLVERSRDTGTPVMVFVGSVRTPGRPVFRIETTFHVPPADAANALMEDMLRESDLPKGQRRKILERGDRQAIVYSFIDLPFLLADRELALRIVHSDDPTTGTHRIDWREANEVLPPGEEDVVRLSGARGYWEFRPDGVDSTSATYLTQTEIGGSIPTSIGDRLLKRQAVEAVARLRGHIEKRRRTVELEIGIRPPSVMPGR